MSTLTNVIKAALTASDEPMTGYDITKLCKTGSSHQQVYRHLKQLADSGIVSVVEVPQSGKPDKRICEIKEGFEWKPEEPKKSDHSKTTLGYQLLCGDLVNGTDHFTQYQKELSEIEDKFASVITEELEELN